MFVTNSPLLVLDRIATRRGVLHHLEVVQTHAELAQHLVAHLLQLADHLRLQLLVALVDLLRQLLPLLLVLGVVGVQLQDLVIVSQTLIELLRREVGRGAPRVRLG